MTGLNSIRVTVEGPGIEGLTENVTPLLHEIRHALTRLSSEQKSTTIDLQAIPFGPGDERRLIEFLGKGEVRAVIDALGESRVYETRYPGIWVVEHLNTEDERIALQIEVTEIPEILCTQQADLALGLSAIGEDLNQMECELN